MNWDDQAATWSSNEAVVAYAAGAFESLKHMLASRAMSLSGARILDFGCGTGLLSRRLAEHCRQVVAIDTSPAMIAELTRTVSEDGVDNIHAVAAPIRALVEQNSPLVAEGLEGVVCSSVCAFVEDYPATVKLLAGLLTPGGFFVQWDWERSPKALDDGGTEGFGFTPDEIIDALNGAGLSDVQAAPDFELAMGSSTVRPLRGSGFKAPRP